MTSNYPTGMGHQTFLQYQRVANDIFNFSNDPKVNKAHVKETLNIDLTDGLNIYGYSKPKRKILT